MPQPSSFKIQTGQDETGHVQSVPPGEATSLPIVSPSYLCCLPSQEAIKLPEEAMPTSEGSSAFALPHQDDSLPSYPSYSTQVRGNSQNASSASELAIFPPTQLTSEGEAKATSVQDATEHHNEEPKQQKKAEGLKQKQDTSKPAPNTYKEATT